MILAPITCVCEFVCLFIYVHVVVFTKTDRQTNRLYMHQHYLSKRKWKREREWEWCRDGGREGGRWWWWWVVWASYEEILLPGTRLLSLITTGFSARTVVLHKILHAPSVTRKGEISPVCYYAFFLSSSHVSILTFTILLHTAILYSTLPSLIYHSDFFYTISLLLLFCCLDLY